MLRSIVERRQVTAVRQRPVRGQGRPLASELDGDALVSLNLWGFGPEMPAVLAAAMAEAEQASEEARGPAARGGRHAAGARPGGISRLAPFRVLPTAGRCIGVTHPEDLALAQAERGREVGHRRASGPPLGGGPVNGRDAGGDPHGPAGRRPWPSTRPLVVGQAVAGLGRPLDRPPGRRRPQPGRRGRDRPLAPGRRWALRPRSETRSFGNLRGTILAALLNAGARWWP